MLHPPSLQIRVSSLMRAESVLAGFNGTIFAVSLIGIHIPVMATCSKTLCAPLCDMFYKIVLLRDIHLLPLVLLVCPQHTSDMFVDEDDKDLWTDHNFYPCYHLLP